MNAILGFTFIVLGFSASMLGAFGGAYALLSGRLSLLKVIRQWSWLTVVAAIGSFIVMEVALFQRDYTLEYVSKVGSSTTPALYNFAALWSRLEGSLILWVVVLTLYIAAINIKFAKRSQDALLGWALVIMLFTAGFFFALMVAPANPFATVDVAAGFDGPGPNPLLQNHILVAFHPPILYLGYVGFTVPFAFAIASLITGRVNEEWLVETRRWTVAAWSCLTFGIVLGAWWSYEVLGWGGFWAWDPVENASLLPWLTGTAYLHSVMIQQRRGLMKVWNLSLLCATFALIMFGTMLTRSGVFNSVHDFGEDGSVGPWFLGFFALVVLGSIGLIAWRGDELKTSGELDSPVSREGAFLANNFLFGALTFIVLLGTTFPLVVEFINDSRFTVSSPYFDSMSGPLGLLILFLMAIAPVLPWKKTNTQLLQQRLFWPAIFAVSLLVLLVVLGARGFYPLLTFSLGGFAGATAVRQVFLAVRRKSWRGFLGRTNGGMIVHIGVVLLAVGLAAAESYKTDNVVVLERDEPTLVEGHEFTFVSVGQTGLIEGPNGPEVVDGRIRDFVDIRIDDAGVYSPAITRFAANGQPVPTPSVRPSLVKDIYLVIANGDEIVQSDADSVRIRIVIQPMVVWIWIGGILMAFGSLLAIVPENIFARGRETSSEDDSESVEVSA